MKLIIILTIARTLDVVTTLLNTNKWGYGVEGNVFMQNIIKDGLLIQYQFIITALIVLIAELLPKYTNTIYVVVIISSLFVAVTNLGCYLFIK